MEAVFVRVPGQARSGSYLMPKVNSPPQSQCPLVLTSSGFFHPFALFDVVPSGADPPFLDLLCPSVLLRASGTKGHLDWIVCFPPPRLPPILRALESFPSSLVHSDFSFFANVLDFPIWVPSLPRPRLFLLFFLEARLRLLFPRYPRQTKVPSFPKSKAGLRVHRSTMMATPLHVIFCPPPKK